jgi:hypothetical protein
MQHRESTTSQAGASVEFLIAQDVREVCEAPTLRQFAAAETRSGFNASTDGPTFS